MDKWLKDSFPVEVTEKVTHLALDGVDDVHVNPDKRTSMGHISGKLKLFIRPDMLAWYSKQYTNAYVYRNSILQKTTTPIIADGAAACKTHVIVKEAVNFIA